MTILRSISSGLSAISIGTCNFKSSVIIGDVSSGTRVVFGRHHKNESDADRPGERGDHEISPYLLFGRPGNGCLGKHGRHDSLFDLAGKRFDHRYCSRSGREKAVIVSK